MKRKTTLPIGRKNKFLVILVGKSGVGKDSFLRYMKLEDYSYKISARVRQELIDKGLPVNHNTVQPIMHQRYKENPYWQIPYILDKLDKKKLLIVNGCRSLLEIKKLIELYPGALVVEIRASTSIRRERLNTRDGTDQFHFKEVEKDEGEATDLPKILEEDLVDIVIMNNGSLKTLKLKSEKFVLLLSPYLNK